MESLNILLCTPFPKARVSISDVIRAASAMTDSTGLIMIKRSEAI